MAYVTGLPRPDVVDRVHEGGRALDVHRDECADRGACEPREVQLHIGWGASSGRHAMLVWERDQAVVVVTGFPIPVGEHVRIDRYAGENVRSAWGVVVDGREGFRAEDRETGAWVHWLHLR